MGYGYGPPPPPPPPGYGPPPPGPGYGGGYGGYPPNNHLVWAILTTIFCCLPFGIISIVYSTQVNSKFAMGDHYGAVDSANKAKMWAMISAGISLIGGLLYFVFVVLLAVGSSSS